MMVVVLATGEKMDMDGKDGMNALVLHSVNKNRINESSQSLQS